MVSHITWFLCFMVFVFQLKKIAPEYYENLPCHHSWSQVIWDFIMDPEIGPYARVKRKRIPFPGEEEVDTNTTTEKTNGHAASEHTNGHSNGQANGHANGISNGYANGHSNGHANGNGHAANGHTPTSNGYSADLIENSKLMNGTQETELKKRC